MAHGITVINEERRGVATLKVLTLECGCKKHVCLVKNDASRKPCRISCSSCSDHGFLIPCSLHRGTGSYVRRRPDVAVCEYFV